MSLIGLSASAAAGQGAAAPAGIIGQVTDNTGAVLPGVTVVATSPALQVPQISTVTDERGEYRLSPLPIGTYAVTYELSGFQNLRRENVRLTAGFVAKLDQALNLSTVNELVTVSGASPLVDVTNTATTTEITSEKLDMLPTTRDGLKAFMGQVPGARPNLDVGASSLSDTVVFRIYGQTGESWQMLEGVLQAAPSGTGSGSHLDFNAIEGARVQSVGSNAEMPRRGLLVDAIMKSGGNDFHGSGIIYGSSGRLEANNNTQALAGQGVRGTPKLHTLRDVTGNIGGPIIRNKLWFFGDAHYEGYDREVLDAFYPDGTPVLLNTNIKYAAAKLSYQMTPGNRFTGFAHHEVDFQRRGANRFVPAASRENNTSPVETAKGEWELVRGSSLVMSLQHGYWYWHSYKTGLPPANQEVATRDVTTLFVTGDPISDGNKGDRIRHHTKGVMTWYRSNLFGGKHEFKAGFDQLFSRANVKAASRPSGNYQLIFNNGAPFQIATFNFPVEPQNLENYVGVYGQDAWTVGRRLTLNLGLRWARDNAYAPAQCREAGDFAAAQCWDKIQMPIFNSVAPRLHAVFDLFGNGKTVIKGGWGRFDRLRDLEPELTATNRNNSTTTTWDWHDLNGNRGYDRGEINLDPNGPDFRSISGVTDAVPNPNEKLPKNDEFSLTLERELMANTAVRVSGIYSRNFNQARLAEVKRPFEAYNIPVTNPDPGPDGRVGTSDDPGTFLTYYEYPASLSGRAFAGTMLVTDPRGDSNFKTIYVAGTKRLSQGWEFNAAYTATKQNMPFPLRQPYNPNAEINVADRTWEWQGKVSGAYTFPYEIIGAVNFEHRSGAPQARQVLVTGGQTIRSLLVNAEPIGSIRLPSTDLVDFRAGKRIALGGGRAMELRMDVFNLLNINTVIRRNLQSGSSYLVPLSAGPGGDALQAIILPRIVQLGATFKF